MLVAEEGLLTFGTDKVFDVPLFAEGSDHSFLDWSSAGAADGNAHLVVASQAIQFAFHFARTRRQLNAARLAVEVVRVVGLALCLREKNRPKSKLISHSNCTKLL